MKFTSAICRFLVFILLFQSLAFISCNSNKTEHTEQSLSEVKTIGDSISDDFVKIIRWADYLADYTEKLYEKKLMLKNENILKSLNGSVYKQDDGGSAVFVSSAEPFDQDVQNAIKITSALDSIFSDALDTLDFLVKQVGYYDRHTLVRIFPFIDVQTQFAPDLDIRDYDFYLNADPQHNPSKKNVRISKPYADPAGRGWMISSVSPVYSENSFQGVIRLDVNLDDFLKRVIYKNTYDILIVDSSGVCIAIDDARAGLFNLPLRKNMPCLQKKFYDDFSGDDINLLKSKNKSIRTAFHDLMKNHTTTVQLELDEGKYILTSYMIPLLSWFVVKYENK